MAPNYYTVLGLPSPVSGNAGNIATAPVTTVQIKQAARRALLQRHPDKLGTVMSSTGTTMPATVTTTDATTAPPHPYGVSVIYEARKTLLDPKARAAYDRDLREGHLTGSASGGEGGEGGWGAGLGTGMEVVDLEELEWLEQDSVWVRSCRCGNLRGFEVREADLELVLRARSGEGCGDDEGKGDGEGEGELVVGCTDCSLCILVMFGVAE